MKFYAKAKLNDDKRIIEVEPLSIRALESAMGLKDITYEVTINKPHSQRSLHQNALLWKLIGEINKTINGTRKTEDDEEIYCQILEMAGADVQYMQVVYDGLELLRRAFRVVRVVEYRQGKNNALMAIVKVYKGTSIMSKDEMCDVIEQALVYANAVGIDTETWKGELLG